MFMTYKQWLSKRYALKGRGKLTPRAKEVLDYLQRKGTASPRDALLDIDINSGSFTRRVTELVDAGYTITKEHRTHPITGRRYVAYTFNLD